MQIGKYIVPNRSMEERMTRWAIRQRQLIKKLHEIVEHVATDGAEITPELVQDAKFILKSWHYKKGE